MMELIEGLEVEEEQKKGMLHRGDLKDPLSLAFSIWLFYFGTKPEKKKNNFIIF